MRRGPDFYGTAVNTAARVAAQTRGGQALGTHAIPTAGGELNLRVRSLGVVSFELMPTSVMPVMGVREMGMIMLQLAVYVLMRV